MLFVTGLRRRRGSGCGGNVRSNFLLKAES